MKSITDAELHKGMSDGNKFQVTAEGNIYVVGITGSTYVRIGTLPVNTTDTRAEILNRLRNANPGAPLKNRRGAGRGQAKQIVDTYCDELNNTRA